MASLWRSYQVLMGRHPWTVQIVTAGSLVGVGDVIAQQLIERRGVAGHNVRRTAKMMGVGFFFVGPVIGSWYKVLDRLVAGGSKSAAFKKMTVDQCSKRTDSGGERRQDAQGENDSWVPPPRKRTIQMLSSPTIICGRLCRWPTSTSSRSTTGWQWCRWSLWRGTPT
ncbi:protein Mpv17 isoform X8 [Nerophis ophidion]|uniref:protein Mpv17 isoform X8 n=1 Tax=Nerophis ophidion TaxID=159077 RepID=UPI002AE00961|nr:protein Mpv17 isoform X8 [Nerophis ophidion]